MTEPPINPAAFNDGLRKFASFAGQLLFGVGKAALTAFIKDNYACEWDLEKVRIRKVKQLDGKPGWIVFDPAKDPIYQTRLDFMGEWKKDPQIGKTFASLDNREWRDDTEFDTFDDAARIAAEFIKETGGKG